MKNKPTINEVIDDDGKNIQYQQEIDKLRGEIAAKDS